MKIGIIVYSQTEHTYSVAQKIEEALLNRGHSVNIERIDTIDAKQTDVNKIKLKKLPDLTKYDALVFGSPVHGFSLSRVMTCYMSQIPSLQDKNIACFVTNSMPFNSTGGNQTIAKMKKISESKGGTVSGTGIVVWNKDREKQISKIADELSRLF